MTRGDATRDSSALFVWGSLALFGLVIFTVGAFHEPWRDEADTWLATRDLPLLGLRDYARHVGTPALIFLVSMPLAKSGLPYQSFQLLGGAFALASAYLILRYAPFHRAARLGLIFSFFLSYEYSVIVRSYGLSLLLFVAALASVGRQESAGDRTYEPTAWTFALLALLANTNAHSLVLSGAALLALCGWPPRKSAWITVAGIAVALYQLVPPPDPQLAGGLTFRPQMVLSSTQNAFFPGHGLTSAPWSALAIGLVAAVGWRVRDHLPSLVLLVLGFLGLWCVYAFVYTGNFRHWGFLAMALVGSLWLCGPRRGPQWSQWALAVLVAGALVNHVQFAARHWWMDVREPYSMGRAMAHAIAELPELPIAAHLAPMCEPVLVDLPVRQFWYPGIRELGSYMKFDTEYSRGLDVSYADALERARAHFRGREFLFLTSERLAGLSLVAEAVGAVGIEDENYFLYRIDASDSTASSP